MKTKINLLALLVLIFTFETSATIINVNNATPSPGEYSDLQTAIDAASPNDTLYLAPTNLSYGNVEIDKTLHLIGPGFGVTGGILGSFAEVGQVTYTNVAGSGSSMQGLKVDQVNMNDPGGTVTFSNMLFSRCFFTSYIRGIDAIQNSVVEGCVFTSTSYNLYPSTYSNITVTNNILNGTIYSLTSSVISNNVLIGSGSSIALSSITGSTITNNIALGTNINFGVGTNTISGNCAFGGIGTWPGPGSNLNVDPLFLDFSGITFTWASDFNLSPSSPCIGSGAGGEDMGVYGGQGIYRKDGEPSIPIIRTVSIPAGNTVPANATFDINIISEAHE